MKLLRRNARLRPGTLWVVFIVALLLGAAAGWTYRWWTERTIRQKTFDAAKGIQQSLDKVTK